jgi:hypothetical protein
MAQLSSGTPYTPSACYWLQQGWRTAEQPLFQNSKFRQLSLDEQDRERVRELNFTLSDRGSTTMEAEHHLVQHHSSPNTVPSSDILYVC